MAAQQDTLGFEDPGVNESRRMRGKSFDGMLGVDGEGHVVWYYHLAGFEAWDFLPSGANLCGEDGHGERPGTL